MKVIQVKFAGLFGNQCITYATARAWAERLGAELQTDPWVGETLFCDVPVNRITGNCDLDIKSTWFDLSAIEKADVVRVQYFMAVLSQKPVVDGLAGCQMFEFSRSQLRKWLRFRTEFSYESEFDKVIHLRFWDPHVSNACARWYSRHVYPCANISEESYRDAIKEAGYDVEEFEVVSEREPHTLPTVLSGLQYVVDFQICSQAKVLFRANSSFSWLAAALGNGKIYSPMMVGAGESWDGTPQSVKFEEGNHGSFWPGGAIGQSEVAE